MPRAVQDQTTLLPPCHSKGASLIREQVLEAVSPLSSSDILTYKYVFAGNERPGKWGLAVITAGDAPDP